AIAFFYTAHFSMAAMGVAIATLALIVLMRAMGFRSTLAYLLPAVVFWVAMLKSGVHATVAGVVLGAITPASAPGRKNACAASLATLVPDVRDSQDKEEIERGEVMLGRIEELVRETESPLARLERTIHPWVSYLILPVFALVNA